MGLAPSFKKQLTPLAHADGSPASAERPLAVAFHDACHMIHGQGIKAQPRQLLKAIPHLALKEALDAGVCCGSAGIYNLVRPEAAAKLGQMKVTDLAGTGASLAAISNIGCTLQLRQHAPDTLEVLHPMQLLSRSFQANP